MRLLYGLRLIFPNVLANGILRKKSQEEEMDRREVTYNYH